MTQRVALIATAGVAAFVAVMLGAVITYVLLRGPATAPAFASPGNNQSSGLQVPAPDFNGQPSGGQDQTQQQTGGSDQTNGYTVSADEAANIALNSAPGATLLQQPRLVRMNGTVVYEVPLDRGFVYVDASSGQVLFNGANGEQPRRRFHRPGG